jgi:hypothetical protein
VHFGDIAADYAKRIHQHAAISSSQSLYPGNEFRDLSDFLSRPYPSADTQWGPPPRSPPATHRKKLFASLYLVTSEKLEPFSLNTVRELEDLGDSVLPGEKSFALLVLRGYPSPEWLNALGGKFGIDPEFFRSHLSFTFPFGRCLSEHPGSQTLPSCHENMVSLHTTTVSSRQNPGQYHDSQARLESLRQSKSEEMRKHTKVFSKLGPSEIALGDPVARHYSVHGLDYYSIEQALSVGAFPVGGSWIGITSLNTALSTADALTDS